MLNIEDQKYYEALFETFSTPGWKHIMEKWEKAFKAKNSVLSIPEGGFEQRKGEHLMLDVMLRFEEDHRRAYEELSDDAYL